MASRVVARMVANRSAIVLASAKMENPPANRTGFVASGLFGLGPRDSSAMNRDVLQLAITLVLTPGEMASAG